MGAGTVRGGWPGCEASPLWSSGTLASPSASCASVYPSGGEHSLCLRVRAALAGACPAQRLVWGNCCPELSLTPGDARKHRGAKPDGLWGSETPGEDPTYFFTGLTQPVGRSWILPRCSLSLPCGQEAFQVLPGAQGGGVSPVEQSGLLVATVGGAGDSRDPRVREGGGHRTWVCWQQVPRGLPVELGPPGTHPL